MSKLGYTWYTKDWNTSEAVFELNLEERGFYRELIDLAMLNDNKTEIKFSVWRRKFDTDINTLENILHRLETLKLIKLNDEANTLFIPSCEPRLKMVRGGKKGGQSKPITKGIDKGTTKPIVKPTPKQSKVNKSKVKEIEIHRSFNHLSISKVDFEKLTKEYTVKQVDNILDRIENYAQNKKYKNLYLTAKGWLSKEVKVESGKHQKLVF